MLALFQNARVHYCSRLRNLVRGRSLFLLIGFLGAFGCELFDAGLSFAVLFRSSAAVVSRVQIGWGRKKILQYGLGRCED